LLQLQESKYNISSKRTISIAFYGGEPLLNFKGIKNIVLFLKQFISDSLSFRYYMTTNGVLLNDISFFVENDFQITISIDGDINQNSFRVFADGKSSFDLVYQNILTIKNTYPEFYSNNVYLLSILHSKNDYISLYIFFQNLGKKFRASTLATEDVKPSKVNEFENIYKDGILSNDELLKIKSFYPDIFKDTEERLNPINEVLISLNQKWNIFNEIPPKVESTCFLFQSKIFLSVSGFIYPCEKVSRKLPFGTFNNGEIKYFTEKIKDYYNILTKKREATCRDCYDKDNCSQCFFVAPDMDYEKCKINENKYCCRLVEIIEFNEKSILEY
jgi:uncharacterized protein